MSDSTNTPEQTEDTVEVTPIYSFEFVTYATDDTGYYLNREAETDITVFASTKEEALKKVWKAFKGESLTYHYSRKAQLLKVEELQSQLTKEES